MEHHVFSTRVGNNNTTFRVLLELLGEFLLNVNIHFVTVLVLAQVVMLLTPLPMLLIALSVQEVFSLILLTLLNCDLSPTLYIPSGAYSVN